MSISFDQNISLCLKSDTKIIHFKVNFVFLQATQQKYGLSLTISLWELIVSDKISQIHDRLKFELHEIEDGGSKLLSKGGRHKVAFRH